MQTSELNGPQNVRPNVIICDDDVEFSRELVEALERRGHAAFAQRTMTAARATILSPTVLVLDLCMPDRDGIEIMAMLAGHPRKDAFRIILMSGTAPAIIGAAAMLCEVHGLRLLGTLRKPVDVSRLCALLENAAP